MATRKVKRYGGNDESVTSSSPDPLEAANNSEESQSIAKEAATAAPKAMPSFKEAFASARRAGDQTFEWNGKKFTTELATAPAKKAEPKPSPKAAPKAEAPAAKTETPTPAAKKETYRDFSGKVREKTPDVDTLAGVRESIGRGLKSAGEGVANYVRGLGKTEEKHGTYRDFSGKTVKYAKGGMTASKRGDGIASRGKTRCKIC